MSKDKKKEDAIEMKCDLCAKSKHKKIKNQWGQTFYYCTNDEPNEYSDGCVWGDRAEGKWLMDDGMNYNGEVVGINNPESAYLVNNCPSCGVSFVVSDAQNFTECDDCHDSFYAETFNSYKVAPELSSYTVDELVDSIAGPQGSAAYDEMVYDPIAQDRLSAESVSIPHTLLLLGGIVGGLGFGVFLIKKLEALNSKTSEDGGA